MLNFVNCTLNIHEFRPNVLILHIYFHIKEKFKKINTINFAIPITMNSAMIYA